jgi:Cu(I)/Ag(I) efflux system membrane fusion protein
VNRIAHSLLGVAGITLAVGAGYWLGDRQDAPAGVDATAAGDSGGRKILYYRNPMGLPDTSPVPKKDSMGMDYIAVYEGEESGDAGVVTVSAARVQTLGVKIAPAERRTLDATIRAVGRIEVNERTTFEVAPRFEGWIERLFVNATGDPVKKGQPLFSVYSPELTSAQKELRVADALLADTAAGDATARQGAERLATAARERLRNWDIDPVAANGDASASLVFRSPANGIVLEKNAVEGTRFMPGTSVFKVADLSTVWVIADVYEKDLERVRVGQQAAIYIDAFPGRRFDARLTYLYPTLNAPTRTTPVRVELRNPEGVLRPGMFAHVELALGGGEARLTVPSTAVIDSGASQSVLVALDEGRFKPQPVKLGLRSRDHVEILDGLTEGERVVVSANFLIDAESNLKAALANFSGSSTTAKSYQATGAFEDFDAGSGMVMLQHAPIAELQWPAMTMEFDLASPELVKGLAEGTPIHFEFEARGPGKFVVTRIAATTAGAGTPAAHGAH